MAHHASQSWSWNLDGSNIEADVTSDTALLQDFPVIAEEAMMGKPSGRNQTVRVGKNRHDSLPMSEWDRIREPFTKLYHDDGIELKEVMRIMAVEYNFHASVSMYKKQSASWGLSKIFTTEEKAELGRLAEKLIKTNQELPAHDPTGRRIPWDRVRRQYGRNKIPLEYFPPQFQGKGTSTRAEMTLCKFETSKTPFCADPAKVNNQETLLVRDFGTDARALCSTWHKQSTLLSGQTEITSMMYVSSETQRAEKLLFHINEYYMWCQSSDIPRSVNIPLGIWIQCEKAWAHLKQDRSRAYSSLVSLAVGIRNALQQPDELLPGCILGIWATLQDKEFGHHGLSFAQFLVNITQSVLGQANPLSFICRVLLEDATENVFKHSKNSVSLPTTVDATHLVDELHVPTKEIHNAVKTGSSLLNALIWHDDEPFGWPMSLESESRNDRYWKICDRLLKIVSEQGRGSLKTTELRIRFHNNTLVSGTICCVVNTPEARQHLSMRFTYAESTL